MNTEINGYTMHYEVYGKGYPLIMLHGNGEDMKSLLPLAMELSKTYQIYLIDSRGHGQSTGEVSSYDVMGNDLVTFMKVMHIKDAHVFGYSDGAINALKAVIISKKHFNKLILCGLNLHPSGLLDKTIIEMKEAYQKEKNPLIKMMLEGPIFNLSDIEVINNDICLYFGEFDLIKIDHQKWLDNN